mmetsp:Transcript_31601/g.61907  ORF Transcript_31601/g.61907 Transcript_31601/m.61907 type:complete len:354 (+) Transcript_31601:33-1094(+)
MVLWVDEYRPTSLGKLELHPKVSKRLKTLVASGDIPHLLFYGPSGGGKRTRIRAVLRELYGSGVEKLKICNKIFTVGSSKRKVEIATLQSNYHIEMCPADAGVSDTHVITEVIKEIAQTHTLDPTTQRAYKIVVLNEVDRLSQQAQNALRRTMEKYMMTCRIFMCCESSCRVIDPLRSRCLGIRVPAPETKEIVGVLTHIAKKEKLVLSEKLATKIAESSDRNLRRAILMFEATKVQQYPFQADQKVNSSDWEMYIDGIVDAITQDQSPLRLLQVRSKLYELLGNCIPPDVIMKTMVKKLLSRLDDALKPKIIEFAAFFEHRMKIGSKPVYHLEAFVAKFMSTYKAYVTELFA